MKFQPSINLLRERKANEHSKVTFVELFFDLVFVFTIIQLSHSLAHHFHLHGIVQTFILILSAWIVWIYTTWHLNWLDPDKVQVRIMLYIAMLAGLVLSTAVPAAFEEKGLFFGAAFAAIQIGRTLFITWATYGRDPNKNRVFVLISLWLSLSGVLWILGGLANPAHRLIFWVIALGIEFLSPMYGFWVPGIGKTGPQDWDISGAHMAERCGLFIIICLGESICVDGAAFSQLPWTLPNVAAFFISFVMTVLMWWNYFHCGQYAGSQYIENSDNPGKVAMWAYHYAHIPIVVGIIFFAAAADFLFKHPTSVIDSQTALAFASGGILFMLGCIFFKRIVSGKMPTSDFFGLTCVGLSYCLCTQFTALAYAGLIMFIFLIMAILEYRQAHQFRADQ